MREGWAFRWTRTADRFHAVFDVFCQRWHLYGMRGDRPLLLKLTANLTPFGTMIFIPAYWSFDSKRDLNWRAITALHKARGVPRQGPKLRANQLAARLESIYAIKFSKDASARKLKGEARVSWILKTLKRMREPMKDSSAEFWRSLGIEITHPQLGSAQGPAATSRERPPR
jgi:hypothetical protein